jgi:hypothetical protein
MPMTLAAALTMGFVTLMPVSAIAALFHCNLQKVPPMGVEVDPKQFIKEFTFDSLNEPAEKYVQFGELSLTLHREGTRILMKVASATSQSLMAVSEKETEIYLQLGEDAVAVCLQ